jgi:hypothetical protein
MTFSKKKAPLRGLGGGKPLEGRGLREGKVQQHYMSAAT